MKLLSVIKTAGLLGGLCLFGSITHSATISAFGPSSQSGTYVKSTTHYFCNSSNGTHTALDICVDTSGAKATCGTCNATNVRAMLDGTFSYTYFGGCAADCDSTPTSCNGGAGNYIQVTGSNGYDFRQLHLNATADSFSKNAARGTFMGMWGSTGSSTAPHVHADNRKNGTRLTAWYNGFVTCGSTATSSNAIGQVTLQ